jgi:biopolymer transport protein ExbD
VAKLLPAESTKPEEVDMSVGIEGSNQEVELNLAPIIDCFTVLITYLLVTASFLTLVAVDVGVSMSNPNPDSKAPPPAPVKDPPPTMTMTLAENGEIVLVVSGPKIKKDYSITITPQAPNQWNVQQLESSLKQINASWADLVDVSITSQPNVIFRDLVNLINEVEKIWPKVYISGG